jgi:lipoate-protein ligase B
MANSHLKIIDLGLMPFQAAWDLQQETHRCVVAKTTGPALLLVEHLPVLTLGRNADPKFIYGHSLPEVIRIDRGGEVTAHMPGQLVAYPVLPLTELGLGPRTYVNSLENTVIATVARFGMTASRDQDHPGVWVGRDKICAIGIRISRRVSLHGIALNVNNSLEIFDQIVPCGIRNRGVTSMVKAVGHHIEMSDVRLAFIEEFVREFGWRTEDVALTQPSYPDFQAPGAVQR